MYMHIAMYIAVCIAMYIAMYIVVYLIMYNVLYIYTHICMQQVYSYIDTHLNPMISPFPVVLPKMLRSSNQIGPLAPWPLGPSDRWDSDSSPPTAYPPPGAAILQSFQLIPFAHQTNNTKHLYKWMRIKP